MHDDDNEKRVLPPTRRQILGLGLGLGATGLLLGCPSSGTRVAARGNADGGAPPRAPAAPSVPMAAAPAAAAPVATPSCIETHDNIEGPYYRDGAPLRADLRDKDEPGRILVLKGQVLGLSAAAGTCAALAGAELDVWQANDAGQYDNDGSRKSLKRDEFHMRGKVLTAADGSFKITTVVPGRYLNGRQYRPAHIHVKVAVDGHAPLTTQLYFPGDPYNDIDPFIHESLIMKVVAGNGGVDIGRFDFVLPALARR